MKAITKYIIIVVMLTSCKVTLPETRKERNVRHIENITGVSAATVIIYFVLKAMNFGKTITP